MGRETQPSSTSRIRSNIDNYGDPYITHAGHDDSAICKTCSAVYLGQRWYLAEQVDHAKKNNQGKTHSVTCPACRKIHDKSPGGIVQLSGTFLVEHNEDIMNLIHNEGARAMTINPMERIIETESVDSTCTISTTNEKLAQRIGRALHKAYSGTVAYKFSADNKLVRVTWHRD
jgi:NMD protein affecting ribosome stability and mRNA decay